MKKSNLALSVILLSLSLSYELCAMQTASRRGLFKRTIPLHRSDYPLKTSTQTFYNFTGQKTPRWSWGRKIATGATVGGVGYGALAGTNYYRDQQRRKKFEKEQAEHNEQQRHAKEEYERKLQEQREKERLEEEEEIKAVFFAQIKEPLAKLLPKFNKLIEFPDQLEKLEQKEKKLLNELNQLNIIKRPFNQKPINKVEQEIQTLKANREKDKTLFNKQWKSFVTETLNPLIEKLKKDYNSSPAYWHLATRAEILAMEALIANSKDTEAAKRLFNYVNPNHI